MKKVLRFLAELCAAIVKLAIETGGSPGRAHLLPNADGMYVIRGRHYVPDYMEYNIDFDLAGANSYIAGVAGTTVNGQFTVQAGQMFLWQQATYHADTAHGTLTEATRLIPIATVFLTDQNSGKNLMNTAAMIGNVFGTGQRPFILPNMRLFQPQSVVNAQVINLGTVAYNIRLSFIGLALIEP